MKGRWLCLTGAFLASAAWAAAPLPGDSIYQLPLELTLQDGAQASLGTLRGRPVVLTMFYASCDGVCPIIALSMRRMEAALSTAQRERLRWVMVSFDPARDTPGSLREFAANNHLEAPGWWLARADEAGVRNLAAVLGIRYRKLPGGAFSHSTEIILLDGEGVIRARTSNLNQLDAGFMQVLGKELTR